jgi:hypothetical protein
MKRGKSMDLQSIGSDTSGNKERAEVGLGCAGRNIQQYTASI